MIPFKHIIQYDSNLDRVSCCLLSVYVSVCACVRALCMRIVIYLDETVVESRLKLFTSNAIIQCALRLCAIHTSCANANADADAVGFDPIKFNLHESLRSLVPFAVAHTHRMCPGVLA